MSETMKAAVLHGIRDVRLEERPLPAVSPRDVLVRVHRVGVCASDVHYFTHGRIGSFVVNAPLILGHESAGEVVAVGSAVTRFRPGDRVALEPGYPCRRCHYCKTGRYNLCPDVTFMATPPVDGAFCEYVAWPDDFTFRIPNAMSYEEGALLEPLSVGLWAARRGSVNPGDMVAVFGAGTIGCVTLQAARVAGATTIIAVDLEPFRLEKARALGATHVINARAEDAVRRIREITAAITGFVPERAGVDAAFETAGALATTRNTLASVRPGGAAILVGLPPDPMVELDIVATASQEIDIRGQFRYANCYPPGIALVEQGRVDLQALVTHHFSLAQTQEALAFAAEAKQSALKVVVDIA